MKKILILLTILLLAISCSNGSTNPGSNAGNSGGTGKPEVEIDPNKANIRVTTERYGALPIRIIIIDSYNKEIPIGQLTTADVNPDVIGINTYSKIFTFTPGTYTLILRPYVGYEMKFENISFSAGSLEEYQYR
ncbi:hypothetical protein [Brachyspira pulli]|uniref:hypothetical protein n=1 Tax=Brachyspira pulli TaxID=310721 RepID=UPI003007A6AC